jgi:hypothetical protein
MHAGFSDKGKGKPETLQRVLHVKTRNNSHLIIKESSLWCAWITIHISRLCLTMHHLSERSRHPPQDPLNKDKASLPEMRLRVKMETLRRRNTDVAGGYRHAATTTHTQLTRRPAVLQIQNSRRH